MSTTFDYASLVGLPAHEAMTRVQAAHLKPYPCGHDGRRIEFAVFGGTVMLSVEDGQIVSAEKLGDA